MTLLYDRYLVRPSAEHDEATSSAAPSPAPGERPAESPSSTDVSPPGSPPRQSQSPQPQFTDILDDPEFDRVSDRKEIEEEYQCFNGHPEAIRGRAMAADFSEGRLETLVGSPLKELAGTQNQYVSYLVTTKVRTQVCSFHARREAQMFTHTP